MRMYELWKADRADRPDAIGARLEDEGGPVLFERPADALHQARCEPDYLDATYRVVETRVGMA